MQPFSSLTGIAAPLLRDDVNTDEIAPIQMMRRLEPDYRAMLFMRTRLRGDGSEDPDFILHKPQFRNPAILVAGANFGCGSSREAAVWTLAAWGVRCIVARSIADIFRENLLQNGLLPVVLAPEDADAFDARVIAADGGAPFTVDLPDQTISGPGGADLHFEISSSDKIRLIEGLDDIGLTLKQSADIVAWERNTAAKRPWMQVARDRRR